MKEKILKLTPPANHAVFEFHQICELINKSGIFMSVITSIILLYTDY